MKGIVFINGHGAVRFRARKSIQLLNSISDFDEEKQYRGEIKLPKGVTDEKGNKWKKINYWFTKSEIHKSAKKAILSQKWHKF